MVNLAGLEAILGHLGAIWGPLGPNLGRFARPRGPKREAKRDLRGTKKETKMTSKFGTNFGPSGASWDPCWDSFWIPFDRKNPPEGAVSVQQTSSGPPAGMHANHR